MKPKQYDLIAFDWDGTLFDSTALIARSIQAAALDLGLPRPTNEQARYVIGLGLVEALSHAVPDLPPERYMELVDGYRRHYLALQHEVSLFPGVLPMLQDLKARHHWLTVATGKSRRGLDDVLATVELRGLFDATRTADETASKPHPQMLQELMREFGVEPERTLMIGDTTHDLQLARNAGAASVGVSFGAHDADTFCEFEPLYVAHSVPDLHQWLMTHA